MNTSQQSMSAEEPNQLQIAMAKLGIDSNDPMFQLYAAMGQNQVMMERLPAQLNQITSGWTEMIDEKLKLASNVALQKQETAIANAAERLIKSTSTSIPFSLSISNFKIAQIAGAIGTVLALGVGVGVFVQMRVGGNISTTEAKTSLSQSDTQLLEWSKSSDGEFARNIFLKNSDIIYGCSTQQLKLKGICIIQISGTIPERTKK